MPARVLSESALRVSDCVTELLRKQPFFGSLVLRLPLRPDPTRDTLATDGHEIRYSPRWIAETEAHLIETAMARVVMACALETPHAAGRARSLSAGRWLPSSSPMRSSATPGSRCRPTPKPGTTSASSRHTTACRRPRTTMAETTATHPPTPARVAPKPRNPRRTAMTMLPATPSDSADAMGKVRTRRRRWRWRPGRSERGRPKPGRQRPGRGWCVRCAAEPRSVRHRRGYGCGRPRRRGRRCRRDPGGRRRRGAGLGRGHAPGAQHRPRRRQGARAGRGNGEGRPCQRARLAIAAAALHDRRGEERLQLGACPTGASSTPASTSPRSVRKASRPSPSSSTPRARCPRRRWPSSGPSCARSRRRSGPRASSCSRSTPRFRTRPSTPPTIFPRRSRSRGVAAPTSGRASNGSTSRGSNPPSASTSPTWSAPATPRPSRRFDVIWVQLWSESAGGLEPRALGRAHRHRSPARSTRP